MIGISASTICSHCESPVPPEAPHCPSCGQPRILDSLLAPRVRLSSEVQAWNVVAIVGVVLFLTSASVAFLREAKVVRVARQALETEHPQHTRLAGSLLPPFLERHPDHEEARFLAAVATARIEELEKTAEHRAHLGELEPNRLAELDPQIVRAIDEAIAGRACNADSLLRYHDSALVLGEDFHEPVLSNLQRAVRRCQGNERQDQADALIAGLVARGAGDELIEETYLRPLQQAIAAGRYDEARSLAWGASRISAETLTVVDASLGEVREKTEASVSGVEQGCRTVASSPANRVGPFWCFPAAAPAAVASSRDGWGRALHYQPLQLDTNLQCYQGFELLSFGADGRESPDVAGSPEADIVCRFLAGREERRVPDGFWRMQP